MTCRPSVIQAAQRVTSASVVREAQTDPLPGQSPRFRSASTDRHASVERGFNQNTSPPACPRQADGLPPPLAWLRRSRLPVPTRSRRCRPAGPRQEPLVHTVSTGFPPRIATHSALVFRNRGADIERGRSARRQGRDSAGRCVRQAAVGRHAPLVDPAADAAASLARECPLSASGREPTRGGVDAAAVARGQVAGFPVRARRRRIGRAPRPRLRPGAKRGSLSSNGRPGTRQGVRTPHLRAAMPVDAYSLAVSCGGRGVSCDIWPASLVRHAPRRALPVLRARRGSPRPARCAAPRPFAATPVFPGVARFRALRLSWPSVVPPPSARYRGYGGPCLAMRRPPTPLRCGLALGRHLLSVTPSRRALPSRPRRTWRPIDAGHSSTASPRRHQLSSYRNACRHWPGGRFCAPSLPESRSRRPWPQRPSGSQRTGLVVTGRFRSYPRRAPSCSESQSPYRA